MIRGRLVPMPCAVGNTPGARVGTGRPTGVSRFISPALLVAGAGVYALAEGPGRATFYVTPLSVGVIAVVAGLVGRDRHLVPAGLGIAGWGSAVVLVHYGVVSGARTTPAYMLGLAAGVLMASYVASGPDRSGWAHSAAVAATTAALFYFLEFGEPSLGHWPAWAVSLLVWAAWLVVQPLLTAGRSGASRDQRPSSASPG